MSFSACDTLAGGSGIVSCASTVMCAGLPHHAGPPGVPLLIGRLPALVLPIPLRPLQELVALHQRHRHRYKTLLGWPLWQLEEVGVDGEG